MTTQFLELDIRWNEAPGGQPILKAYPDPLTKGPPWTIGFGSTGADVGENTVWTADQCYARLRSDLETLKAQCSHFPWWESIGDVRQDVFVQMGYQMGFEGLLKFTGTLAAAARGAWETVAADMKLSLWDKQTHGRAERLAEQARTGVRLVQSYDNVTVQPAPQPEGPIMSFLSKFVFNPILAEIARGFTSSSAATQATAQATATAAVASVTPSSNAPSTGSPNSPLGNANPVIAELENLLQQAVDGFVAATVSQVPVVGGLVAPEAVSMANVALTFAENHAMSYLAALFHFHATNTVPQATTPAGG